MWWEGSSPNMCSLPPTGLTSPSSWPMTGLSHPLLTLSVHKLLLPQPPAWLHQAHIDVVVTFKLIRRTTSSSKNVSILYQYIGLHINTVATEFLPFTIFYKRRPSKGGAPQPSEVRGAPHPLQYSQRRGSGSVGPMVSRASTSGTLSLIPWSLALGRSQKPCVKLSFPTSC